MTSIAPRAMARMSACVSSGATPRASTGTNAVRPIGSTPAGPLGPWIEPFPARSPARRQWLLRSAVMATAAWGAGTGSASASTPSLATGSGATRADATSPAQATPPSVIVVPTAVGGEHDWWVLPLADELRENGHPVEILRMPDANGTLATELVGRSERRGVWLAGSSQCIVDTLRQPARDNAMASRPVPGLSVNAICAVSPWAVVASPSPLQSRTIDARLREIVGRSAIAMLPESTPSGLLMRAALRNLGMSGTTAGSPRHRGHGEQPLHGTGALREVQASSHADAIARVQSGSAGLALVPLAAAIGPLRDGSLVAVAISGEPSGDAAGGLESPGSSLNDVPRWADAPETLAPLHRHQYWYGLLAAQAPDATAVNPVHAAMRTPGFRQLRLSAEAGPAGARMIDPSSFVALDLDRWQSVLGALARRPEPRRPMARDRQVSARPAPAKR